MRIFFVAQMTDRGGSPSLTTIQLDFLASLLPGRRYTDNCQDAITVGALLRLNLITWEEPGRLTHERRERGTFALSQAGMHLLGAHTLNA
jgi:hypothetical protein